MFRTGDSAEIVHSQGGNNVPLPCHKVWGVKEGREAGEVVLNVDFCQKKKKKCLSD